jgi:hypothetical protein
LIPQQTPKPLLTEITKTNPNVDCQEHRYQGALQPLHTHSQHTPPHHTNKTGLNNNQLNLKGYHTCTVLNGWTPMYKKGAHCCFIFWKLISAVFCSELFEVLWFGTKQMIGKFKSW